MTGPGVYHILSTLLGTRDTEILENDPSLRIIRVPLLALDWEQRDSWLIYISYYILS